MSSTHGKLTAEAADRQIKSLKREILALLAVSRVELKSSGPVGKDVCGDPGDARPHAPTQYNYWYEVDGKRNDPRFLPAAKKIVEHYTKLGWDTYGHSNKPSPSWLMRSPEKYLLSLTISPDGDLFGVELSTPCVPKVDATFTP